MKRRRFIRRDEEGVSPVIATILMVAITVVLAAVLYIMVMSIEPPDDLPPIGKWGVPEVKDSHSVDVDWASLSREVRPTQLEIVLERNGTAEGTYRFSSDDEGPLAITSGVDVGTLTYADLADNQKVNTGDELRMTNLAGSSTYILKMIWGPTGDLIDTASFQTPGY